MLNAVSVVVILSIVVQILEIDLIIQIAFVLVYVKTANMTQMIMAKNRKSFVIVIKLKENAFGAINL